MKKWILIAIAAILGLVLLVFAVGAAMPREHEVARTITLHQPAEPIWNVITNYPESPRWRPDVARVEHLPDHDGHPVWREIDKHGKGVPYETIQSDAPRTLGRRIADPRLPFGGTWTFELTPSGEGTAVRITERGYVDNPAFRFISVVVIGQTTFMDTYLKALGKRFGEDVQPATAGGKT
ncbi:MAG: SRPBCC family protein [Thermoanaerobaculia bacterium]